MAKGANVGSAYVTIIPTMKGFGPGVEKGLNGLNFSGMGMSAGGMFASGLGSALMGAIGGIAASLTTAIGSAISGSMDAAISRVDTLNAYPRVMQNLGYSAEDADRSLSMMDEHLQGLPTSLDAMAGSAQNLAPLFGDLEEATAVSLALNDALLAGNKPLQLQEAALEQYSQIMAKGIPEMQDWKSLNAAMPGQMDQIAKSLLGPTAGYMDLYDALRDGTLTMDDFNNALLELDQNGANGFASFEEQARAATGGLATQIELVRTSITRGLGKSIQALLPYITPALEALRTKIDEIGEWFANFFTTLMENIDFEAFKEAFQTLSDAWHEGFGDGGDTAKTWGEAVAGAINALPGLIERLAPLVKMLGEAFRWLSDHAETVAKYLPIVLICMKGMQIAKMLTPLVQGLASRGIKPLGQAAGASAKQMLGMAAVLLALGAAILLASAGFWIMAQAAVALAEAGPMALVAFGIMLVGIAGLLALVSVLGPKLNAGAVGLIAFGAAILIAAIGMGIMAQAAVALSSAGTAAMVIFGIMLVGMIALIVVVAALGPALAVGAGAFLLLAAGMVVAALAASIVIDAIIRLIECIAENAEQINSIISTTSEAVNSFVQTFTDGITQIIDAMTRFVDTCSQGIADVLDSVAGIFDSIGQAALNAGVGVQLMADALIRLTNETGLADLATTTGKAADAIKDMVKAAEGYENFLQVAAGIQTMAVMGMSAGSALMLIATGLTLVSAMAASGSTAIQTMSAAAGASAGSLGQAASAIRAFAATTVILSTFGSASAAVFRNFGVAAVSASQLAVNSVRSAMASIASTVANTRLQMQRINIGPLPHFRFNGQFNAQTGQVPTLAVDWYRAGAVFGRPAIVGVGDAAKPEIITPQNMMADTFESVLSRHDGSDRVIAWLDRNLGPVINEYAPTATPREFARMVRRYS